jgi:LysM repeat protein
MGLFDFVRGIGKKVFSHDEEAVEKIKTEIESANPGVNNLDVHYDPQSGTVALSGQAASAEAMQKAVLMAGNVQGVSQVEIASLNHPEEQEQVEYYIIEQGDTLSKIAQHFYYTQQLAMHHFFSLYPLGSPRIRPPQKQALQK